MNQAKTRKGPMPRNGHQPLRFMRILLENWRNFQRLELPIPPRLFVVGPNASGKSNFLDAFAFLHDLVSPGGGFRAAVSQRGGFQRMKFFSGKHHADVGISMEVGTDEKNRTWGYELRFNQDATGQPVISRERVSHGRTLLKDRPDKQDSSDTFRLGQTYLEQSSINKEFRLLADFFLSIEHVEIVPQVIRRWMFTPGKGRAFGATLLQELSQMEETERERILEQIGPVLAQAVPQLHGLKYRYDALEKQSHLEAQFQDAQGPSHLEDQLSHGTLRLFGIFFTLLRGKGPLLVEEPDLSLHPGVVRLLPGTIARFQNRSGRQVIMTTHSPELLRDEGIALDEVLLLQSTPDGGTARLAQDFKEIKDLLDSGIGLEESIPAKTSPSVGARIAGMRK